LAPSILLLMTCFTRIVIVLSFVRTALQLQAAPANQIVVGLALFMSFFIMAPVWDNINHDAIAPYRSSQISGDEAIERIGGLSGSDSESPARQCENHEVLGTIFMALQDASRRDQEILTQLFGLNDSTPLKLEQVATSHNLTCERVRQIKKKLFESVRQSPYAEELASCY